MAELYKVIVAPDALIDVVRIAAWWSENRPRAPHLFRKELEDALLLLSSHPEIGRTARSARIGNARVVELLRSRYRIYYQARPAAREVLVLHLRHGSSRPLRPRRTTSR